MKEPPDGRHWVFRRVSRIYRAHALSAVMAATLIAALTPLYPGAIPAWREAWPLLLESPLRGVLGAGTGLYLPPPFDILPLYCLFFASVPWVVRTCEDGRLWRVVGVSAGLWVLSQVTLGRLLHWTWRLVPGSNAPDFDPLGWQIVFVAGVLAGWHVNTRHDLRFLLSRSAFVAGGVAALILMFLRHLVQDSGLLMQIATGRPTPGLVRLIDFALLAVLVTAQRESISRMIPLRALSLLGRYSLNVFTFHLVLLVAVTPWRAALASGGPVVETAASLVFAGALYAPAMWQDRKRAVRGSPPQSLQVSGSTTFHARSNGRSA